MTIPLKRGPLPPLLTRESISSTIPKPLVPHQPLQWTGENRETAPIRVNRFPPQTFSRPNQVQSIVQIQYSRVCFINRYYAGPNWRQESSPRWPSCLLDYFPLSGIETLDIWFQCSGISVAPDVLGVRSQSARAQFL